MHTEIDYDVVYIHENQRRINIVPGIIERLDIQYGKQHLSKVNDPSSWTDSHWRTCFPGSYPVKNGNIWLHPWVYDVNKR